MDAAIAREYTDSGKEGMAQQGKGYYVPARPLAARIEADMITPNQRNNPNHICSGAKVKASRQRDWTLETWLTSALSSKIRIWENGGLSSAVWAFRTARCLYWSGTLGLAAQ